MAMVAGFSIIIQAAVSVITFDSTEAKFATWGRDSGLLEQFDIDKVEAFR